VASPDRRCRRLIFAISFCCSTLDERMGKVENVPVTPPWSLSPRMVGNLPDQNNSNQARNPGQIPDSRLPSTRVLGTSWLVFRSPLWHGGSPRRLILRNLIRACCVPPPVTDREEKVVSAKENRKPTASPALEDLLMLKRAIACDASFCVGRGTAPCIATHQEDFQNR
jgi:hypothetical protein